MPSKGQRSQIASWFPAIGLLLGADSLLLLYLGDLVSSTYGDGLLLMRANWVIAAVILASWAFTTRLLHWDGLADVADGFWGGHTVERRLEIMSDSHTGAFGASAIAIVALLEVSALSTLVGLVGVATTVLAVPVFGRLSASFAAWLGKPAKSGGLGASVMSRPSASGVALAVLVVAIASAAVTWQLGLVGLGWCVFAVIVAAAVPHLLAPSFGGVTGDVMGASVLFTEMIVLVAAALIVAW
jgi:adenosylcobinamide-GDP ribazoletransferase